MVAEIKAKAEHYVSKHSTAVLVTGALLVVLGLVGVVDGSFTGFFVTEIFGAMIAVAGITQFIQASKEDSSALEYSKLILSFFYVITGAVVMFGATKIIRLYRSDIRYFLYCLRYLKNVYSIRSFI